MGDERRLTDADVKAIVNSLKKSVVDEFYVDLGRGLWGYLKKALFVAAVSIAAYGSYQGMK